MIELRPTDNAVVIGKRHDALQSRLECDGLTFVGAQDDNTFEAAVRVRSHAVEAPATVTVEGRKARVDFYQPIWGASPGQSAVFYDADRVIGGGTITSVGS